MSRTLQLHSVPVANASLAGLAAFVSTATALQWARVDLNWVLAPLSFYLVGTYGALLKTAYVGLALALMLIGLQFFRALRPGARSDLAPWLFGAASLALLVTAFADTHLPGGPRTTSGFVHAHRGADRLPHRHRRDAAAVLAPAIRPCVAAPFRAGVRTGVRLLHRVCGSTRSSASGRAGSRSAA